MQVTSLKLTTKPAFQPREITLTIENQEQADAFQALFNYHPVCRILRECPNIDYDTTAAIREATGGKSLFNPFTEKFRSMP